MQHELAPLPGANIGEAGDQAGELVVRHSDDHQFTAKGDLYCVEHRQSGQDSLDPFVLGPAGDAAQRVPGAGKSSAHCRSDPPCPDNAYAAPPVAPHGCSLPRPSGGCGRPKLTARRPPVSRRSWPGLRPGWNRPHTQSCTSAGKGSPMVWRPLTAIAIVAEQYGCHRCRYERIGCWQPSWGWPGVLNEAVVEGCGVVHRWRGDAAFSCDAARPRRRNEATPSSAISTPTGAASGCACASDATTPSLCPRSSARRIRPARTSL